MEQKIEELSIKAAVDANTKASLAFNVLLDKVIKSAQEVSEYDTKSIKDIVSTLKDLRDLGAFTTEVETAEIKVILSKELEEYAD